MKHLDEGLLQAWLDHPRSGLEPSEVAQIERHLDECAKCAAELEALRGSSGEAHSLLAAGVDRTVPRPPFDEVVKRARGQDELRRARRRLNRLAWAASLVVALGVGWWSNDLYRSARLYEAGQAPVAVPARSQEAPEAEAAALAEPQADASTAPAPADEAARQSAARASRAPAAPEERREQVDVSDAQPAPEPEVVTNERAGAGSGGQAAAPSSQAPAASAPLTADVVDAGAAAPPAGPAPALARARQAAPLADADDAIVVSGVVRDEQSGAPIASAQVYADDLSIGVLTQEDGRYSFVVPARDSLAVTVERIGYRTEKQALSGRAGEPVVADFQLHQETLQLQEVVVTGTAGGTQRRALGNAVERLEAAPIEWRAAMREVAEDLLGRDLVTLPDASVRSIDVSDVAVRVRQDLGDAVVLTLIQGRGEEGVEGWPIESAGAVASRRVDDVLVTATAPLTEDSLRVLLGRVR